MLPRSATAVPTASRSLPVSRDLGGICGIDSVNVVLPHSGFPHRQRRLVQVNMVRRPAIGRSLGRVSTHECGCAERTPQPGQHRAPSAAVTNASSGFAS